jgi:hypothetical protein
MPQRLWSREWRRGSWIRLLSGATYSHSTAEYGVASWISSLRATRASRSAAPADVLARAILATSGPTSGGLLRSWESVQPWLRRFLRSLPPELFSADSRTREKTARALDAESVSVLRFLWRLLRKRYEGPRLNPDFVEWLMAWPLGWTDFEPVGTEFIRWLLRWRWYLSGGG